MKVKSNGGQVTRPLNSERYSSAFGSKFEFHLTMVLYLDVVDGLSSKFFL